VTGEIDLARIARLQELLGREASAIVGGLLHSMSRELAKLERSLAAGELGPATFAAHKCRNDALMVGARDLQSALSDLETAARRAELEPAQRALARVNEVWPATRAELERAASSSAS
jgi:HPt (histidine-containing phosphotransfer) domain-containing protein